MERVWALPINEMNKKATSQIRFMKKTEFTGGKILNFFSNPKTKTVTKIDNGFIV